MANIKSILLNFCATLFFTLAYFFLFTGIFLLVLPSDFNEFMREAKEQIPAKILESGVMDKQIDQALRINEIDDREFSVLVQQLDFECRTGTAVNSDMCADIAEGKIVTKADLKESFKRNEVLPQLRENIGKKFGEIEKQIADGQESFLLIVLGFLVTLAIGIGFIALESWEHGDFPYSVANYFWGFSFLNLLMLIGLWIAMPYLTDWMVKEMGIPEADITVKFVIEETRSFFIKPIIIFVGLSIASFIAVRLTKEEGEGKTRN